MSPASLARKSLRIARRAQVRHAVANAHRRPRESALLWLRLAARERRRGNLCDARACIREARSYQGLSVVPLPR
jgi:hypothetical protein